MGQSMKVHGKLSTKDLIHSLQRTGWLHCGEHGMNKVNNYLASIDFTPLLLDLVAIKLD
jgi:hypothetical protein